MKSTPKEAIHEDLKLSAYVYCPVTLSLKLQEDQISSGSDIERAN